MTASTPTGDIDVRLVSSKADIEAFIDVPFGIYASDRNWVPPLRFERREHFSSRKNPYFEHADVALWLALRNGRPVGRISTQVCQLYLERYQNDTGHFGFLECVDDDAVVNALVGAAADWLNARGMKRMLGPLSFSINDESGLLVDGFDSPPSMLMNYAKPYYATQLERTGFSKAMDLYAYEYSRALKIPAAAAAMVKRATDTGEIELRPIDMSDLDRELEIIIGIFNDAWSDNWGAVPMTYNEIKALGNNLKLLLRGEYGVIGFYKGEPAAMAITLPNVNDAIRDLKGYLFPLGWLKLLWRLKVRPPRTVRMPLMGVRKDLQSSIVGSALAISVITKVRNYHHERGCQAGELSWILEDNTAVQRLIELMGARHYKTYRVYERPLEAPVRP